MGFTRRLRNIAVTQLNNLKDRLDHIDDEAEVDVSDKRAEKDARRELADPTDIRMVRRTPEEIARGGQSASPERNATPSTQVSSDTNPLAQHFRRLEIPVGSDLSAVEAAYERIQNLISELGKSGGEQQVRADELLKRYTESYEALRDSLDPTAGRFDKLEL